MRMSKAAIAAILFCACAATQALADDCPPLTRAAVVDLVPVQDDTEVIVPVTLNGKDRMLIVDTGAFASSMSQKAADDLGLAEHISNVGVVNVSGKTENKYVRTSLSLGRLSTSDIAFLIWPGNAPFGDDPKLAGLIGSDLLRSYDLDIDFGTHKLSLFSQDHCPGKVLYWQSDAVAVLPMRVMSDGHIQITLKLDGKDMVAILDTGASNTSLSQVIAETQYGLVMGASDTPKTGALQDRPGAFTYRHTFKTLELDGIAVNNPQIDILPDFLHNLDEINATPEIGSRITAKTSNATQEVMFLGMNILRHFHIYIAYKENMIYITPAGAPPPAH